MQTETNSHLPSSQSSAAASIEAVRRVFLQKHGVEPRIFRAPGRVNLIGEHTDYNDGFVMPAALQFATYVAAAPRNDRKLAVYGVDVGQEREFDLDSLDNAPAADWSDYVRGVAAVLASRGVSLQGANLVIKGDVPIGAGLSSSAAIEVATALALLGVSGLQLGRATIARVCQEAEHRYAGTKCGIMDQFISCFGQSGHALLLDCRSLEYQLLPISDTARIVICNSNVKHELASGEYNRRRADCEAGVAYLRRSLPEIRALRDVTPERLDEYGKGMPEVTFRRCRHVVTEDARTLAAADALRAGDLQRFGGLMFQSHRSLQLDYEVSCPELDMLVDLAQQQPGVFGARMTGGGFGGCTVNLVAAGQTNAFSENIRREYHKTIGLDADVYVCAPSDGASELRVPPA